MPLPEGNLPTTVPKKVLPVCPRYFCRRVYTGRVLDLLALGLDDGTKKTKQASDAQGTPATSA